MGQGVQPLPSEPHPAHWVGELRQVNRQVDGQEPQGGFRPSEIRSPTTGDAAGIAQRIPPLTLKRSGNLVSARRPVETKELPGRAALSSSGKRVARPFAVPTSTENGQGRGIRRDTGVQLVRWRVALATVEPPCRLPQRFKRRLIPSASRRRSARRSSLTDAFSASPSCKLFQIPSGRSTSAGNCQSFS